MITSSRVVPGSRGRLPGLSGAGGKLAPMLDAAPPSGGRLSDQDGDRIAPQPLDELVGADRVRGHQLDDAAAFVVRLLEEPGQDIRVVGGQMELGDDVVVPGHPDAFELEPVTRADPGVVWAVDGGSCTVADARAF